MAPDDDPEDRPLGKPLPPEDRLWRHPSELGAAGSRPEILLVERTTPSMGRTLLVALMAGLVGAGATLALVMTTDVFVRERPGTTSRELRDVSPRTPGQSELAAAEKVLDSVARVEASGPKGAVTATAVVFRSDGQLITTADAVDAATEISVVLADGRRATTPDVSLVGKSLDADLAVLRVPFTDLQVAAGTNRRAKFGDQTVLVDASPLTRGPSIAVGVVTREVAQINRENASPVFGLVEATTRASVATLSPGTLFLDNTGAVVGLASGRAEAPRSATPTPRPSATSASLGLGSAGTEENALHYAIPADFTWDVAAQLSDNGRVTKPWIGVPRGEDISVDEANREQIFGGVRVTQVEADSPAAHAGVRANDIIVSLAGENVGSFNDFVTTLRRHREGDLVGLTVLRKSDYLNLYVTVGGKPEL